MVLNRLLGVRLQSRVWRLFTRTTGFVIVPAWVLAMSWLVVHDVLPGWTAAEPPSMRWSDLRARGANRSQFVISDASGPVGSVWSTYLADETSLRRDDLIWFDRLAADLGPLRVSAVSAFTAEGVLDEFTIRLETTEADVELHGERFPDDFSFRLKSDLVDKAFKVPLTDGGLIVGAFHPFSELSNLKVGTRWRMQVVNPIALVTGMGQPFLPLLVEVTGEERIRTSGGEYNCLVVESPRTRAWVDAEGLVQAEEVELPLVGTLRVERQADFDDAARTRTRQVPLGDKRTKRR